MRIYNDIELRKFGAWSGGDDTLGKVEAYGDVDALERALEEEYPDGIDETDLNDILRFEEDWCYEMAGCEFPEVEGNE